MNRKQNRLIILLSLAAMLTGRAVWAEEPLTLQAAIDLAVSSNNRVRIAAEKSRESSLKTCEAWGKLWPEFSSSISVTRNEADKGNYSFNNGNYDVRFIKAFFSINPGSFYNSLKAAQDGTIISVNEERRIRAETTMQTIQLYYQIILSSEIVKLRSESVKSLEENLRIVNMNFTGGSATNLDYLRAKVSTANEKTRLIAAENDYDNALSAFKTQIGREDAADPQIASSSLSVSSSDLAEILKMPKTEIRTKVVQLVGESLRNRPEIIQIRMAKEAAVHDRRSAESVYMWPTFFVSGSYGLTEIIQKSAAPPTGNQTIDKIVTMLNGEFSPKGWNSELTCTAGATYRWGALAPVDSSHAKALQFESRERQHVTEMDELVRIINLEIQKSFLKMVSASHAIESQKSNIASSEEYFRVATLQYKNGLIDNAKLLEANVELKNAKTMYVQALYDFQTAKAELNRQIGYNYFTF